MIEKAPSRILMLTVYAAVIAACMASSSFAVTNNKIFLSVPESSSGSAQLPFFYDFNGKRATFSSKALCKTSYDSRSIVFDIVVPVDSGYKPTGLYERDGVIWNDDRVEIFLQPHGTGSFYQFIINAAGALYDSCDKNKGWNGSAEYNVKINPDNWQVHLRVPFSDIGFDFNNGNTINANVAVACNQPGNSYCLTWVQLPIDFMDTNAFGTLKLSPTLPYVQSLSVSDIVYEAENAHIDFDYVLQTPYVSTKSIKESVQLESKNISDLCLEADESFKYTTKITNHMVPVIELTALTPDRFILGVRSLDIISKYANSISLVVDGRKVLFCRLADLPKKIIDIRSWKPGYHIFEITFLSKDNKIFTRTSQNIFTFKAEKSDFNLSKLDVSRFYAKVSLKDNKINAARSVFDLSEGILPSQISVEGRSLLYNPIQLIFDGKPLKPGNSIHRISSNKNRICLRSTSVLNGKTITITADHQYDGYTWYDVEIKSDSKFKYGPLDLVIPLKLDSDVILSNDMLYYDELFGRERITNIGAPTELRSIDYNNRFIPHSRLLKSNENVTLPLTSWVALSTDTNEEYRGLGISCEGPKGWNIKNYDNIFQVIRGKDGHVDLIAHISDGLTRWNTGKIKFSFGLEPFPIRKYRNDFHASYRFDTTFWPKAYECMDKTVDGQNMLFYDRLAKDGIKMELCHERWTEFENYWKAGCNEDDMVKTASAARKAGIDLYCYFGFLISNKIPEFPLYHDIVMTKPTGYPENGFKPYPYYQQGDPDQIAFGVCYNSIWGDYFARGIADAIKRYYLRGVYYDGGPLAPGCANLKHGCGVIDSYGRLIVSFPVRAYRRMAEMVYDSGLKTRSDFATDIGLNTPNLPAMGLVDSYWTGESSILFDPIGRISPEDSRGMLNGKLYGIPCDLIKRPELSIDNSWAESLVLDTYPRLAVGGGKEWVIKSQKVWKLYDEYQLTSDKFTPFFARSNKVISDNPNLFISYYETDRVLVLIVSNYWTQQEQKTTLDLNAFSGLNNQIHDRWLDQDFELSNGKVTVSVPYGYMRMLVINRK